MRAQGRLKHVPSGKRCHKPQKTKKTCTGNTLQRQVRGVHMLGVPALTADRQYAWTLLPPFSELRGSLHTSHLQVPAGPPGVCLLASFITCLRLPSWAHASSQRPVA
jgi:hypothetical protein